MFIADFPQSLFPMARNAVISGLTELKGSENRVRRHKSCKELQGFVGDGYLGEPKLFSPPMDMEGLCTMPPQRARCEAPPMSGVDTGLQGNHPP